ncbi:xanthine dehydrogenase family protein molybdopterin-binding subunit [Pseudohoeflea sp. DP4N28-3]|uniref:Xanthine dehydrogenase family protein molybdopterin-binding subunit n=1 Tax=Pseudohoeflea coraliihabitans TaxID=2860393 RepID=A0ABS6WMR9_9HYPH|nr:xanthine dehydrogenase family protein molybdopterin-binding subunit [Pseudohoeflea sp. DP4N28-3]
MGDLNFPGQLHARIVRSPVAHGAIVEVDTQAAQALPGVVAVWAGDDLQHLPPIPFRATAIKGLTPYCQPAVARGMVRYVGEPVAVVIAEDPYIAEDAADLVMIDIDEHEPYLDAACEPASFAPSLSCEPTVIEKGYGDVDEAFSTAFAVVELELKTGRHSAVPMETRGLLARYDTARDVLELHGAAKRPHWNRDQLADLFKLSPASIELYENSVGGGFGVRGELYPEDLILCHAALVLKRPVKWIEDRREHLMATNHSREQTHRIHAAVDQKGRIAALDETLFHDQGAYVRTHGARVADMTIGLLLGPYRVPAYRAKAHYRLTNKTPAATYRAPGRFEGTFVRERLVEAIAVRLSLDPMEVRRVNLIASSEMPYERNLSALETDVVLDSGDYAGLIEKSLAFSGWDELRREAERRRAQGESVGVGFGLFVEKSGLGPSELVEMRVEADGSVTVVTGAASLGQGMETAIAQICAETLGVDYRRVRVLHGDTNRIAFGFGAHASRVSVMTGEATRRASEIVRTKALEFAAELLQRHVNQLEIVGGVVQDGKEGPSVTLADLARQLHPASPARGDREPGLSASAWFHNKHMNYPYGAHIAQVRIDQATGHVAVERYAITYDVGRAINPAMIEGQIVGGLAQGLGGALFEEFLYDQSGQPLSVTLADYMMVGATEMPPVDVLILEDAPSPLNPLGIKGAGEGGVTAAGAAIASAVDDALQRPGLVDRLPVTPQYLRRRMQQYDEALGSLSGQGAP